MALPSASSKLPSLIATAIAIFTVRLLALSVLMSSSPFSQNCEKTPFSQRQKIPPRISSKFKMLPAAKVVPCCCPLTRKLLVNPVFPFEAAELPWVLQHLNLPNPNLHPHQNGPSLVPAKNKGMLALARVHMRDDWSRFLLVSYVSNIQIGCQITWTIYWKETFHCILLISVGSSAPSRSLLHPYPDFKVI